MEFGGESITYNNSMKVKEVLMLHACSAICGNDGAHFKTYYPGACNSCCMLTSKSQRLQRCASCQLVAYCGRDCQRSDWKNHKKFCKMYKVKDGENALIFDYNTRTNQSKWNTEMDKLRKKSYTVCDEMMGGFIETVFSTFSRVCNICKEAEQDKLFDCSCCCVAYCCKEHQDDDKIHKRFCEELVMFPLIHYLLLKEKKLKLPCLLKNTVQTQYEPIEKNHMDKIKLKLLKELEKENSADINCLPFSSLSRFDLMFAVQTNHLAFPLTVLSNLVVFGMGKEEKPVEHMSSLNIHIVTFSPVFDSSVWEYFMHLLPSLTELNISFITNQVPGTEREPLDYQGITLERCSDCESKGRIINYSVHVNHYHTFFSSKEYTVPDVVAVFGNILPTIMYTEEKQEHQELSYQKMTNSDDTLIILTDMEESILNKGIEYVCQSCPSLELLMPPVINPMAGSLGLHGTERTPIFNHKKYVCCLRNS